MELEVEEGEGGPVRSPSGRVGTVAGSDEGNRGSDDVDSYCPVPVLLYRYVYSVLAEYSQHLIYIPPLAGILSTMLAQNISIYYTQFFCSPRA